jgi:hypothetical protein
VDYQWDAKFHTNTHKFFLTPRFSKRHDFKIAEVKWRDTLLESRGIFVCEASSPSTGTAFTCDETRPREI